MEGEPKQENYEEMEVHEINRLLQETENEHHRLFKEREEKWPEGHITGGAGWEKSMDDGIALLEKMGRLNKAKIAIIRKKFGDDVVRE